MTAIVFIAALISLAEFKASRLRFSLLQGSPLPLLTHVSPLLLKVSTAWLQKLQQLFADRGVFIAPMLPLVMKKRHCTVQVEKRFISFSEKQKEDRNSNKNGWVAKKKNDFKL